MEIEELLIVSVFISSVAGPVGLLSDDGSKALGHLDVTKV